MKQFRLTVLTSILAAVLVFALLLPTRDHDSDPPECFSMFGYVVPCGPGPEQNQGMGFALSGALLAAALVGIGSAVGRRESDGA
ncbi:MAG: hypothetical protein WEB67_04050 [Acidimicrobiia bacterium]